MTKLELLTLFCLTSKLARAYGFGPGAMRHSNVYYMVGLKACKT